MKRNAKCARSDSWLRIIGVALIVFILLSGGCVFRKQPLSWHLTLEVDPNTPERDAAVQQTVKVLESRLNAVGVRDFRVTPQGNGRIRLDLSAEKNPEHLKTLITAGGKLELTHVISPPSPAPVQTYPTKEQAVASLNSGGTVPANRGVLLYAERDGADAPPNVVDVPRLQKWVVVEFPAIVSGSDLRNADAVRSRGTDSYEIVFSLTQTGAQRLGSWTGANTNEYLGVVLNDQVKSIAFIKSQITDSGVITGRFTKESAEDLALVLKSGALPAAIRIVEERIDK